MPEKTATRIVLEAIKAIDEFVEENKNMSGITGIENAANTLRKLTLADFTN